MKNCLFCDHPLENHKVIVGIGTNRREYMVTCINNPDKKMCHCNAGFNTVRIDLKIQEIKK